MIRLFAVVAFIGMVSGTFAVSASAQDFIKDTVTRMHQDPKSVLNATPVKRDRYGRVASSAPLAHAIANHVGLERVRKWRLEHRRMRMQRHLGIEAGIVNYDRAEDLVDNAGSMLRTLEEIEGHGLLASRLPVAPWSDDYWGYFKGGLSTRYADPAFPKSKNWKQNYDYAHSAGHTFGEIWNGNNQAAIDLLSPAEKYDALTGQVSGAPLSSTMWGVGKGYWDDEGQVADWMGICDGWSAASIMAPRPTHTIEVTSPEGRKVRFRPFDIKALNSVIWAWGNFDSRFIGGRCDTAHPQTDENGRVTDPDCFNTNPGTWHLAVVNQIGVAKRGFVMDSVYDLEVWNQPILSYAYRYFNPQTGAQVATLAEAAVTREQFTNDKFKKYRSPQAAKYVGIAMNLTYVEENENPGADDSDDVSKDHVRTVQYLYDVELDAQGKIIGGEWYTNLHPDFLWVPEQGDQARSIAEGMATGNWDGVSPLPATWSSAAARASSQGQPLARVLGVLNNLAR